MIFFSKKSEDTFPLERKLSCLSENCLPLHKHDFQVLVSFLKWESLKRPKQLTFVKPRTCISLDHMNVPFPFLTVGLTLVLLLLLLLTEDGDWNNARKLVPQGRSKFYQLEIRDNFYYLKCCVRPSHTQESTNTNGCYWLDKMPFMKNIRDLLAQTIHNEAHQ